MELSPKTRIDYLLNRFPFLMDFILRRSPKFKLLQNPVARRTVGKVATLSQVASIGGIDTGEFLSDIAAEIRSHTREEVMITDGHIEAAAEAGPPEIKMVEDLAKSDIWQMKSSQPADVKPPVWDRKARQEILKGIIRDLHQGEDMAVLKDRFKELIRDVDPAEIAAMEQGLIDEGMPESEIKRLCDVHVQVFRESLNEQAVAAAPPGHPVNTFMMENRAAEEILQKITAILDEICEPGQTETWLKHRDELKRLVMQLSDIDLHYQRKELQLFARLEAYGIKGPSEVMWAIHDDIRSMFKAVKAGLENNRTAEALAAIEELVKAVDDMIYKEEHILFPMSMEKLSDADWQAVSEGEDEIGFAWIEPPPPYQAGVTAAAAETKEAEGRDAAAAPDVNLDTGHLSLEQVNLILKHLPLELSFVDEKDEVKYYTQHKNKIFARGRGSIGRKVQNCHPQRSLAKVQKILDEFRAGTRDKADFWINSRGRFVYIAYYAVRDSDGNYRGTLEAVQDISEINKLKGEKRLLDWE